MATVVEAAKLHANEVWAIYGGELEYCLGGEGADRETETLERQSSVCSDGRASVCESPRYYSQLEALKRVHLQNVAELEVKYLNELIANKGKPQPQALGKGMEKMNNTPEDREALPESSAMSPTEVKAQQNLVSKAEHDTPVERRQKERREEEEVAEVQATATESRSSSKSSSTASSNHSRDSSRRSSDAEHSAGADCGMGGGRCANVTVPKPFKMMLREEDKKRRNVKTRSEMELENTLLRKELEELRQCHRQFRASPVPQGTRAPLGEVTSQRGGRAASLDRVACRNRDGGQRRTRSRNTSPQPFSFMERERKKREERMEAALAALASREEPWVFKARPLPRIYRQSSDDYQLYEGSSEPPSRGREQQRRPGGREQRSLSRRHDKEPKAQREAEPQEPQPKAGEQEQRNDKVRHGRENEADSAGRLASERPFLDDSNWRLRRKPSLAAKALLLEGEMSSATCSSGTLRKGRDRDRDRDWSYIHPIHRAGISLNLAASLSGSQERIAACKNDYISV